MSGEFDPNQVGLTEREQARLKIIQEVADMKSQAIETGAERLLPYMDSIEEMSLRAVDENYPNE